MSSIDDIKTTLAALSDAVAAGKDEQAIEALNKLQKDVQPTEDLLRVTRAGVVVGKLRSNASPSISALAKTIVGSWKVAVDETKKRKAASGEEVSSGKAKKRKGAESSQPSAASSPADGSPASTPVPASSASSSSRPIAGLPSSSASKNNSSSSGYPSIVSPPPATPRTFKSDAPKHPGLGDDVRDKCVMLIYDALAGDSNQSKEVILEKAKGVEKGFFTQNESKTDNAYRQKIRGICTNLKDKANQGLRDAVVRGELKAGNLATMSKEDMASSSLQALNKKLETENLFNSQGATEIAAETDQFKCGKCGKNRTTYYQMQTRSADEPMTTFVTCLNCNNRWKFS